MIYFLALGSNKGDRYLNIKKAVDFLSYLGTILKTSSIYKTEPVAMRPGTQYFYNLVLSLKTNLNPLTLLKKIKTFEELMGRDLMESHKKPRIIDIDILLAENEIIETESLVIPHKEMTNRGFVLIPMREIAPEILHPLSRKTITELASKLTPDKIVRKTPLDPD